MDETTAARTSYRRGGIAVTGEPTPYRTRRSYRPPSYQPFTWM